MSHIHEALDQAVFVCDGSTLLDCELLGSVF